MDLPPLVGRDLAVAVGVGHVEMAKSRALRFLERHPAVLIRVGRFEHAPGEMPAHHAHARSMHPEPAGIAAALGPPRMRRVELGAADRSVIVGV